MRSLSHSSGIRYGIGRFGNKKVQSCWTIIIFNLFEKYQVKSFISNNIKPNFFLLKRVTTLQAHRRLIVFGIWTEIWTSDFSDSRTSISKTNEFPLDQLTGFRNASYVCKILPIAHYSTCGECAWSINRSEPIDRVWTDQCHTAWVCTLSSWRL